MRVKGSVATRKRRKKILQQAKGYVGSKGKLFRTANEQMLHSLSYAYRDRRNRKRDFRSLWIKRLNGAVSQYDLSYSKFIEGLKKAQIYLNRKLLSEIAFHHPESFSVIVNTVKRTVQ